MRLGRPAALPVGLALIHAGAGLGSSPWESGSGSDGYVEAEPPVDTLLRILNAHQPQQAELCLAASGPCGQFVPQADLASRASLLPLGLGCAAGVLFTLTLRICTRSLTKRRVATARNWSEGDRDGDGADGFSMSSLRSISGGRTASFTRGVRTTPLANADSATFSMDTYPVVIE